jgi:hypothetical protein
MKKMIAAAAAGLTIFAAQATVAQPDAAGPVGSHRYCDARWDSMVANHTTGDQTRDQFMDSCLVRHHEIYSDNNTLAYLAGGVLIAAIVVLAFTNREHPASP